VSSRTAYQNRAISPQEQILYDHLLVCAESETPDQLIERFQALFIAGVGYPYPTVVEALDQIVCSKDIEEYFHYILNRCCHILINRWHGRPHLQQAVPDLLDLFDLSAVGNVRDYARSRSVRNLHRVVEKFTETEQFLTLQRLSRLIKTEDCTSHREDRPLGTLIQRYPYLYEYCLVSEDCPAEHHENIRRIQAQAQHQFEINLSHYVTYRVRQARLRKQPYDAQAANRLRPVENPTLLSDRELVRSLNQFSGKVDHGRSYSDSARIFLQQSQSMRFGQFKRELYDYLGSTIEPSYGSRKFNKMLAHQLENTSSLNDDQQVNEFLVIRTCSQLLNFLVLESTARPQHFVFIDLINNLGPLLTTGLILKVVLLCRKVKPYLEKRFSILFGHYETVTQNNVEWLVKMFENLNVALSMTFGTTDISPLIVK
jgi:hypothetical protein